MNTLQEQILQEEREEFTINNLEGATWAFRKLRAIKAKEDELKKVADEEIAKVKTWLENELKTTQGDREYFEGLLTEYYKTEKDKDSKFKLSTPYGKISSRTTDKYYYEDEEEIKNYCSENGLNCIKIKKELDKNAFKKLCKGGVNLETGEVVPGVRVEKETSISVKVD